MWLVTSLARDGQRCARCPSPKDEEAGWPSITLPSVSRGAVWFGRNRRGGRAILHHRRLGPVLFRDWSRSMELFTGTVAASAETWNFRDSRTRTTNGNPADFATEYLRPAPGPIGLGRHRHQASTLANPRPLAQPRGGRPMPGHERRFRVRFLTSEGAARRHDDLARDQWI
jgi:hypothetical protein